MYACMHVIRLSLVDDDCSIGQRGPLEDFCFYFNKISKARNEFCVDDDDLCLFCRMTPIEFPQQKHFAIRIQRPSSYPWAKRILLF